MIIDFVYGNNNHVKVKIPRKTGLIAKRLALAGRDAIENAIKNSVDSEDKT